MNYTFIFWELFETFPILTVVDGLNLPPRDIEPLGEDVMKFSSKIFHFLRYLLFFSQFFDREGLQSLCEG